MKILALLLSFLVASQAEAFKVGGMTWVTTDGSTGQVMTTDGHANLGWLSVLTPTAISATSPLVYNSGTGNISIPVATNLASGYLLAGDWINFNNRIIGLSGDVSATGPTGGTGPSIVAGTVNSVGGSTAANVHAAELLANAAVSTNTASTIVRRDSSGNFSAGTISAALTGNVSGNASTATALAANPVDCGSNTYATTIAANGDLTCASITNASTTGTSSNTGSTLVLRDGSGNFSAGTITASLTGHASLDLAVASNLSDVASSSTSFNNISGLTTLGDTIYGGASGTRSRLAGNTTTTKECLSQTGTGSGSAAPAWAQVAFADLSGSATGAQLPNPSASTLGGVESIAAVTHNFLTSISTSGVPTQAQPAFTDISGSVAASQMPALTGDVTTSAGAVATSLVATSNSTLTTLSGLTTASSLVTVGSITSGTWGGTAIAIAHGGTGATSKANAFDALSPITTLGDIIYGSAGVSNVRLAGNTTSTINFLSQTGTGSVSAAPVWTAASGTGSVAMTDSPSFTTLVTAAAETVTGKLGVIAAPGASDQFSVNGTSTLAGATQRGIGVAFTSTSAATSDVVGVRSALTTAASTAVTSAENFRSGNPAIGSSGSLTRFTAFLEPAAAAHVATNNASISDNLTYTGNFFLNQTGSDPSSLAGPVTFANTTDATTSTTGSVIVSGGIGVAKAINVGTTATVLGQISQGSTSTSSNAFVATSAAISGGGGQGSFYKTVQNATTNSLYGDAAPIIGDTSTGTIAWAAHDFRIQTNAGTTAATWDTSQAMTMAGAVKMPNIASSSAPATGSLCWTTSTGNVTVDTTLACLSSTLKIKEYVEPIKSGLDEVMALRPISYNLKDEYNPEHLGRQVGFIAEEVNKVDERLVGLNSNGEIQGVRYMQLTSILTKAIQEQQAEILELKRRLKRVENHR